MGCRSSHIPLHQVFIRAIAAALVAFICLAFAAAAKAGPGADIYNEFVEKEIIYPDDDWQDYVTEVGERVLAVTPHAGRNYTFTVTDQSFVNAIAATMSSHCFG